jgi:hypothetical protein
MLRPSHQLALELRQVRRSRRGGRDGEGLRTVQNQLSRKGIAHRDSRRQRGLR